MANIDYPPLDAFSTPAINFTSLPWTAPSGSKWIWKPTKAKWGRFVPSLADLVSDAAFSGAWSGDAGVAPSKNSVYDKFEALLSPVASAFVGDNPNVSIMTVTGNASVSFPPLVPVPGVLGYLDTAVWTETGALAGANYVLGEDTGSWLLRRVEPYAQWYAPLSASPTVGPWTPSSPATGVPALTGAVSGSFRGQRILASSGWWSWDGLAWVADVAGGRAITVISALPTACVRRFSGGPNASMKFLRGGIGVGGRPDFSSGINASITWDTAWRLRINGVVQTTGIGDTADPADASWLGDTIILERQPLTPLYLGQRVIVSGSDGFMTEWSASETSGPTWTPNTSGVIYDETNSQWIRLRRVDGALDFEPLADQ